MAKKKKIREEFEVVFKAGDDKAIKKMLAENPWLLEELSQEMDSIMREEDLIAAAVGVMEDDLNQPISLEQILLCLKEDFNTSKKMDEVRRLIHSIEKLNLVKKVGEGWVLTDEGGDACDEYIKKFRLRS